MTEELLTIYQRIASSASWFYDSWEFRVSEGELAEAGKNLKNAMLDLDDYRENRN